MGRSRGVSTRKRAASNGDKLEPSGAGEEACEGKKALYHCNYCNKDISGKIRVKCVKCPDFDLCVECFSVGAEVTPHKSNHPYRVMDSLSFPLICPDWNADEEILLLEGIEMYGMGNWAEVAQHVGTKSKAQCIQHYTSAYINSPCFPLPDMSHAVGKNRKELVAMNPSSAPSAGVGSTTTAAPAPCAAKKPTPEPSGGDEGPSLIELSGYNPKRHEFDPEYDNDAEQAIADMEFKDTDTEAEHELKLRMLRIYSARLDERKQRKDFIIERNLLYPDPLAKDLSPEEREIYQRYNVFMRFHSKEEHEALIKTVIEEHRIRKSIRDLQEARDVGCRTTEECGKYIDQKKRKEAEEYALKANNSVPTNSLDEWDVTGLPGSDLLSASEKRLCTENRMLPCQYLKIQEVISMKIFEGAIVKKSDAHPFFKVDPSKVDRIYNILVKKGIAPQIQ